jgi:predicted nucleic acid-binding protein
MSASAAASGTACSWRIRGNPSDGSSTASSALRTEGRAARSAGAGKSCISAEFVDTNVLIYAHDGGAGKEHERSVHLLSRLVEDGAGAVSIQVLAEFYAAATKRLGITSQEAEEILADLGGWIIHRPGHADLVRASSLSLSHDFEASRERPDPRSVRLDRTS